MTSPRPATVAVVPLRAPGSGKTRLRPRPDAPAGLSPAQRAALTAAMFADVVAALTASSVERIVVAAADQAAARHAAELELAAVLDAPHGGGLSAAVDAAGAGAARSLVVSADLPLLRAQEVETVLDADEQVVIAPTARGGTGGLLRRPPEVVASAYGTGSASRHHERAVGAGASVRTLELPGFHHDVDTWADLRGLHGHPVGAATGALLATLDLALR